VVAIEVETLVLVALDAILFTGGVSKTYPEEKKSRVFDTAEHCIQARERHCEKFDIVVSHTCSRYGL